MMEMTMRFFPTTCMLAMMLVCGAVVPTAAAAGCEFSEASITFDLSNPGAVDPYGDNVTRTLSIPLSDDCGLVWLDYDRRVVLDGMDGSIPAGITVTTGSATSSSDRRTIPAGTTVIDLRIDMDLRGDGIPASGSYISTTTFALFDAANGGNRIGALLPLTLSLDVAQVMTLSLTGSGLSSGARVDLGIFEEGVTRTGIDPGLNLTAVSNDPYRIEIDSRHGWRIVNGSDAQYAIPYSLRIDGRTITGNPGTIDRQDATDSGGIDRPLDFTVTPGTRLRAGIYEDEVTITIFGND